VLFAGAQSVREFARADGKARVFILLRDDGHYMFVCEAEREDNGNITRIQTVRSGLYDSLGAAQDDAFARFPWLGGSLNED
jgi:hypothetical protein